MAYYLVLWLDDCTKSVIPKGDILSLWESNDHDQKNAKKPDIFDIVKARWEDATYKAKILRISTSRKYLETISVSKDGNIIPSHKKNNPTYDFAMVDEEILLAETRKKTSVALKNTEKQNNHRILRCGKLDESSANTRTTSDNGNMPNNTEAEDNCSVASFTDNEHAQINMSTIKNGNGLCSLCAALPPVTPEMILGMELMLNHFKAHQKNNVQKIHHDPNHADSNDEKGGNIPHWKISDFGKIEIVEYSGVWLKQVDVEIAIQSSHSNVNELIRRLFKLTLGKENLHKYCALGSSTSGKIGVPQDLKNAIHAFVMRAIPGQEIKNYNRIINLMCMPPRSHVKKQKIINESGHAKNPSCTSSASPENSNEISALNEISCNDSYYIDMTEKIHAIIHR